jgi:tRNA threonylcarbamoyladenosine biosynthesis protein TsaE
MKAFHSFSSEETKRFGGEIAESLLGNENRRTKAATVIALRGDLGAGKTTFTQGFFRGLGIRRSPTSPTFVLMRRYAMRRAGFLNVYHIDAYRLSGAAATDALDMDAVLKEPRNIVLVEWPEKIEDILPRGTMRLDFAYGKKENERIIKMRSGFLTGSRMTKCKK